MRLFSHPVLCNYYVTYRCNAKCGFCDIWEKPSPYVTPEQVKANLQALKRLKVRVIDFTGGEPLLHRQLPEFLRMAKEMGFVTTVTTNTLLYPKQAESLAGLVDMLHFSLDSADRDKHNASRGVDCYDHLIRSIEIARGLGEKPDILFTVTEENFGEIGQVYEEISRPAGLILILNPVFEYNEVGESLSREAIDSIRKWKKKSGIYLNEAFLDLRLAGGNQPEDPICKAASSCIVISPENELMLPCYHLQTEKVDIDRPLDQIWRGDAVKQAIAEEGRLEACRGCTINCYMEPSFAVDLNRYFLRSLRSTMKYSLEKWVYA